MHGTRHARHGGRDIRAGLAGYHDRDDGSRLDVHRLCLRNAESDANPAGVHQLEDLGLLRHRQRASIHELPRHARARVGTPQRGEIHEHRGASSLGLRDVDPRGCLFDFRITLRDICGGLSDPRRGRPLRRLGGLQCRATLREIQLRLLPLLDYTF